MVVTQRLLKTKDGEGRVGAFEIMKCTSPIQNLIREAKIHQNSKTSCKQQLEME